MKRLLIIPIPMIALFVLYLLFGFALSPPVSRGKTAKVVRGPFAVWSAYEGRLEARRVIIIMSRFRGNATVIELAREGAKVSKGDLLVPFDSSAIEREVLKLKRDYTLARSELNSLKHAKIPLELRDLELDLIETRSTLSAEQQYLDASVQLAKEGLVSEQEIKQQKLKVAENKTQLETLELQIQLTKKYLHPSALKRAQAKLASAEQELKIAREQLQNSVVLAPTGGVVVYKPLHIGTEFRTIRIGDSVFPNQGFMVLADMNDLVVHSEVPESELSRVQEGKDVFVQPLAYPDIRLHAVVETVGSRAQNLPGRPDWQKFFHVVIGLKDIDPRLRSGMSVNAHILSYYNPKAILIPRTAVWWEDNKPFGKVVTDSSQETQPLNLGMANEGNYEVIGGLKPGNEVLIE